MSIFTKIKSSKKAADAHKATEAAKQAAETSKPPSTPYRHVPTHAAQDALAGTPGTADREAIRQANQARAVYAQDNFYSTSSPSLTRSYSSDAVSSAQGPVAGVSMSRTSSRAGLHPRSDRRAHPGYQSYNSFQLPSPQRSRRSSSPRQQPKSPLSSEPITPNGGSTAASSSGASFSSNRSYTDPIEPSAPFSERLEAAAIKAPSVSAKSQSAPRTPLYTARTTGQPKPWEVAAARKQSNASEKVVIQPLVAEIPAPAPTAQPVKRARFMGFKGKQQAVAAC